MKQVLALLLFVLISNANAEAQINKATIVKHDMSALMGAIRYNNERADKTREYIAAISQACTELCAIEGLSESAKTNVRQLCDQSLKKIDDAAENNNYANALGTAMDEYGTVVPAMTDVVKKDFAEQERIYNEEKARMELYTHPFDYMNYSAYSRVTNNPTYNSKVTHMRITRVALSTTETRVECWLTNTVGENVYGWVSINPNTYLYDPVRKKKYTMRSALNIATSPSTTDFHFRGEQLVFALIFPALPSYVKTVNLVEPDGSEWVFNNIKIR